MLTPWGSSQQQYSITDGVFQVSTAGHGGILVSVYVAKNLLSPEAIAKGWHWNEWYAYEEDCDWAFFGFEQSALCAEALIRQGYPPKTGEEIKQMARAMLALAYPDYLAQVEKGKHE